MKLVLKYYKENTEIKVKYKGASIPVCSPGASVSKASP